MGSSKKALVFNSCGFMFPQTDVTAEDAVELRDLGYEVVFAGCGACFDSCFGNPEGYRAICRYCHACQRNILEKAGPGIRFVNIGKGVRRHKDMFKFKTMSDLKSITYRDVYVGYGVLSNYVSTTRSGNFVFDGQTVAHLRRMLANACAYVDEVVELFAAEKPDVVSIFNGRFLESRAFFDICRSRHIPVRVLEVMPEAPGVGGWRKIIFNDCLPHDVDANTRLVLDLWEMSALPEAERMKIGAEFFERRAVGVGANDADMVFTQAQESGLLPDRFETGGKNIVIFNSSEDEFAAIGREFDRYALFEDQVEGIKYILNALKDSDYKVTVRIHPNLSAIDDDFVNCLYDLPKKYGNVIIIPPESKISSYALLRNAEKVVTFGSTMGIEAVYWGKPSVLLRTAFYMNLDGCYRPKTREEAVELLKGTLSPKDKKDAIKYGFWLMNQHLQGTPMRHFPFKLLGFRPRFLFGKYRTPYNLTVGGSPAMATLMARFLVRWPWLISRRRTKFPKPIYCTFRTIVKR